MPFLCMYLLPSKICNERFARCTAILDHITELGSHGCNRRGGMPTDLFREHTGIHNAKSINTMNLAFEVHNARSGRGSHARGTDGMVQSESLFVHELQELIVGDIVDIAARVGPPV